MQSWKNEILLAEHRDGTRHIQDRRNFNMALRGALRGGGGGDAIITPENTYATWSKAPRDDSAEDCVDFDGHAQNINEVIRVQVAKADVDSALDVGGGDQDKIRKKRFKFDEKFKSDDWEGAKKVKLFTGGTLQKRQETIRQFQPYFPGAITYALVPEYESLYTARSVETVFDQEHPKEKGIKYVVSIGSTDGHVSDGTLDNSTFLGNVGVKGRTPKEDAANLFVQALKGNPTAIWLAASFTFLFVEKGVDGLINNDLQNPNRYLKFEDKKFVQDKLSEYITAHPELEGPAAHNIPILQQILEVDSIKTVYVGSRK